MGKRVYTYQSQQFGGVVELNPETKTKRIKMNSPQLYQHFLNTVCKIGDLITLNITDKRPKRSEQQNRYLFLYYSLISTSSGHSIKEIDAWARERFLTKGISEVFGDTVRVVSSHKDLNVLEFMEFLTRIEEVTGIPLPITEPFLKPLSHEEYAVLKGRQRELYEGLVCKVKLST